MIPRLRGAALWPRPRVSGREELVVAVEPKMRIFMFKEPEAGNETGPGERVNRELGDGLVCARIGLVVKDVESRRCGPEGSRCVR